MKFCKYCAIERADAEFEIAAVIGDKIYRRLKCQQCKQTQQKQRIQETSRWLQEYKKTLHCECCGFSDYRALEFHHRDPAQKEFEVGNIATRGGSLIALKKEIEKCSVLCANCHRITHFREKYGM